MRLLYLPAIAAGLLCGALLIHPASAQTQAKAKFTGALTDPSESRVAGATITAQAMNWTHAIARTKSAPDGTFLLELEPGRYEVTIRRALFAPVSREFALAAGETRTWDVRLELEKMSSSVVVSAAAQPEKAATTPSLVDVITGKQIEQSQGISLLDALISLEGASFGQLGPMGGIASFFLDGGNSSYTKVLIDGTSVNEPGGYVDFSDFTLDDVDKIEVVHGASSALYGSDAMDGVIQIFTHRGTTRTPEINLEGDGGTFGTGRGSGQISGLLGAFDYSAAAGYISSQGQGQDDFDRATALSGNFGWKLSNTDSLRLTLRNSASDAGQPGQTLLPGEANYGQSGDLHNFSSHLAWNFATGDHWRHEISGFEYRFQDLDVTPPYGSFLTKYNRAGLNEQSTYLFRNGGVTAGYRYEVENGPTAGRHNQAGFVEARYVFLRRLTVIAGGRMEANGFFGTRFVPRAGASYALRYGQGFWGATRLRVSYGQGIKEPDILPQECSPQLDPEQSRTVEAGIDQDFASSRVHFAATFFHNDFRDIISFAYGGSSPNCPAYGGSYFNTGKARADGADASFEVKASRWLNLIGNYTYDDSKVIQSPYATDPALVPGNRLFQRPLHSANLIADAHFHRMNWNLSGNYEGRRTDSDFDGLGITSDASYVRWDLANSIVIGHGFSTVARVENLFNRHYELAVGYPALRLHYRLGLKYEWGGEK